MLLEIAVAMPIVLVALGLFASMLTAGTQLRSIAQEDWICTSAGQALVEQMRNETFREVFRLYNPDPLDDPGGPGTGPGNRFAVPGLRPVAADPAGMVGEVLLPWTNVGTELSPDWQVREDLVDADLGIPRDLNGDCRVDDLNHADDYSFLPVIVRLRWQGRNGPREFELTTALSELR